jgi:hypothetical protein
VCTAEKCIDGICVTSPNPDTNDPNCCQVSSDCVSNACSTGYCSVDDFRCFYRDNEACSYSEQTVVTVATVPLDVETSEDDSQPDDSPGVGDIIGAIIGFIILGVLVIAFIFVVILMIIQKIVKKLTSG